VKFKFQFHLEPDGAYGSYKNGQWTGEREAGPVILTFPGMIKQLRTQKADMAVIGNGGSAVSRHLCCRHEHHLDPPDGRGLHNALHEHR
jgi:hypothetical protein